jgi:histidinol-phosphate aminotransferase
VGYLLAGPDVVAELSRIKQPYNLNAFSQFVAGAVLKYRDLLQVQVEKIKAERDRLFDKMAVMEGVEVYPTDANFILFRTNVEADRVFQEMLRNGVLIRNVSSPGLEKCMRVTVGTEEENHQFLEKLKIVLNVLS